MSSSPLEHLQKLNESIEEKRERRAVSAAGFSRIVEAAQSGEHWRLSGADRAMLYFVAVYTGLGAQELASLKPESFDLDATTPVVTVQAGYSKRRREDLQPLPADLTGVLRDWLNSRHRGELLWPGSWWNVAAEMLRKDLDAACSKWVDAAGSPESRLEREQSDRFKYVDDAGLYLDFHALRHTYISNIAAAGVHPKLAQQLARHSTITLTMDRYTHVNLLDVAGALEKLPSIKSSDSQDDSDNEPPPI